MDDKKKNRKPSKSDPWSDDELRIAVDGYLYMLRLELSGVSFSAEDMAKFLMEGPLSKRNDASIRYRMRNISYVFDKKNLPILKAYSPASGVGSGVRLRIEKLLDERSEDLLQVSTKKNKTPSENIDTVFKRLDLLEKLLSNIDDKGRAGIGHNNPPDPIEDSYFDINGATKSIQSIKDELASEEPNKKKIEKDKNIILELGLKLAIWSGNRFTDFSKAAAIASGTGFGLWAAKSSPQIIDTMKSLAQYLQTLG